MMNIESVLNNAGLLLKAYAQRRIKQMEMQKPVKVSVIIPVYNAMPYFADCMRSLLVQTLEDIELIVVDDGSTDGSGELAAALAEVYSIVTVIRQKNAGVSAARNAGLERARGKYIGFVDADDFVEPEMYEKMFMAASDASAQVACTWFKCVYDSEDNPPDKLFLFHSPTLLAHDDIIQLLPGMNTNQIFHFTWRNIFSKDLLENEKIRFNESIAVGEDTLFNMQALLSCAAVLMLPGTPYCYRIHKNSCMGSSRYKPFLLQSISLQYEEKLRLFDKYFGENTNELLQTTAEYTIKTQIPLLVKNIYTNNSFDQMAVLKHLFCTKMVMDALKYYDINTFRSKSFDWQLLWFAKNKRFLLAHMVCKYILYKK